LKESGPKLRNIKYEKLTYFTKDSGGEGNKLIDTMQHTEWLS